MKCVRSDTSHLALLILGVNAPLVMYKLHLNDDFPAYNHLNSAHALLDLYLDYLGRQRCLMATAEASSERGHRGKYVLTYAQSTLLSHCDQSYFTTLLWLLFV